MTNQELIDLLLEFDPELPVAIASDEEWNEIREGISVEPQRLEKHGYTLEMVDPEDDGDNARDYLVLS
jgi:hypothetical protein